MIEEKVKDILKKYRNLEQKKDWKNQKLLGNDLKFSCKRFDKCICGVRKRI